MMRMSYVRERLRHLVRDEGGWFWAALPAITAIAGAVGNIAGKVAGGRAEGRKTEAELGLRRDANNINIYQIAQQALLQALQNQESGAMGRAGMQNDYNTATGAYNLGRGNLDVSRGNLDLSRRQFQLGAGSQRARQAFQGDILSRSQDVGVSGVPSNIPRIEFSGGIRPSMLSPESRQLGQVLTRQALMGQLAGDQFDPLPARPPDLPAATIPPPTDFSRGNALATPPRPTPMPQASGWDKLLGVLAGVGGGIGAGYQGYRMAQALEDARGKAKPGPGTSAYYSGKP